MNQRIESATPYDESFYDDTCEGSRNSAKLVLELLFSYFKPQSLVDVGCGEGHWLAQATRLGVPAICGLDGNYVKRERLAIPEESFVPADLSKPFEVGRTFDLAMSLEVAEHLDPDSAGTFVECLVKLASAVLFSAAIPGQGGTDHRNEQWQSYWANLFAKNKFVCVDLLRPKLWQEQGIEVWYRQNTLLYLSQDHDLLSSAAIKEHLVSEPANAVHAELYEVNLAVMTRRLYWAENPGVRKSTTQIGQAVKRLLASCGK